MGQDDADGHPDHTWRLVDVDLRRDGAWSTYECDCGGTLLVPPAGVHPESV